MSVSRQPMPPTESVVAVRFMEYVNELIDNGETGLALGELKLPRDTAYAWISPERMDVTHQKLIAKILDRGEKHCENGILYSPIQLQYVWGEIRDAVKDLSITLNESNQTRLDLFKENMVATSFAHAKYDYDKLPNNTDGYLAGAREHANEFGLEKQFNALTTLFDMYKKYGNLDQIDDNAEKEIYAALKQSLPQLRASAALNFALDCIAGMDMSAKLAAGLMQTVAGDDAEWRSRFKGRWAVGTATAWHKTAEKQPTEQSRNDLNRSAFAVLAL